MPTFKTLISKVRVNTNDKMASSELAREILSWLRDVEPEVVVGSQKKGGDKWKIKNIVLLTNSNNHSPIILTIKGEVIKNKWKN